MIPKYFQLYQELLSIFRRVMIFGSIDISTGATDNIFSVDHLYRIGITAESRENHLAITGGIFLKNIWDTD